MQIHLPNKEYISNHRCERTSMTVTCKIFVNVNFVGIHRNKYDCQTISDHRCERKIIAVKYEMLSNK